MKRLIKSLNVIFFVFFLLMALIIASRSSTKPFILIYSFRRFTFIIMTIIIAFYFGLSIYRRKLSEFNFMILIGIFIGLIFLEISIHIYPKLIPIRFIELLRSPFKEAVIKAHRLNIKSDFIGDGLCYFYKPFTKLAIEETKDSFKGKILIDELGFRNSILNQKKVEIVLLGDSIIFSGNCHVDLGDILRQKGFTVLNLSIGGYSPQHWVDIFLKFGKRTNPKYVFAFFFDGNDFFDAIQYYNIQNNKKTYEEYLNYDKKASLYIPNDSIINDIFNRFYLFSFLRAAIYSPRFIFDTLKNDFFAKKINCTLNLNGKRFEMKFIHYTPSPEVLNSDGFKLTIDSIKRLKRECDEIKTKLFLVYVPANSTIYAKYSENQKHKVEHQKIISQEIKKICEGENIYYIDTLETFQEEVKDKNIFLENGEDTHFRSEGLGVLAEIVSKHIKNLSNEAKK